MNPKDKPRPLTEQQLFINPIAILQKQHHINNQSQIKHSQQQHFINPNQPNQTSTTHTNTLTSSKTHPTPQQPSLFQTTNFTDLILDSAHTPNTQPHSKTKSISKNTQSKIKNYRTSMCPYGIQCRKRLTCTYAHNQYQLRRPYKNRKTPCLRYQKGLCGLGAACPDYHGNMDLKKKNYKYKVQICKQWQQKGQCKKGKLCIYLHGDQIPQLQQESEQNYDQQQKNHPQSEQQINQIRDVKQKEQAQLNQLDCYETNNNVMNQNQQPAKTNPHTAKLSNIFQPSNKKTIIAKQVIQQKIPVHDHQALKSQKDAQNQDLNIQFNF